MRSIQDVVVRMVWAVALALFWLMEKVEAFFYNFYWRRNVKLGDYCTFRDITTRGRAPFNGRGVGRISAVTGKKVTVERLQPKGETFFCTSRKLRYLPPQKWSDLHDKMMVAGLALGLKSRGL